MNRRTLCLLVCFLVSSVASIRAQDNRYYAFGPDTGPLFVITTPEQADRRMVEELEQLAGRLADSPPAFRLLLAVTSRDFSPLPDTLRKTPPEGTASLIARLSTEEDLTVLVLFPGQSTRIRNGFRGSTPPRWLLESAVRALEDSGAPWELEEERLPLYRVGWIPENPLAAAYQNAGIPVLCLEAERGVGDTLLAMVRGLNQAKRDRNDRHYLLERLRGRYFFIGEEILVVFMIAAFSVILAIIFIFSFLFGKKSEQRMKDLFRLWWLPFFYLAITWLSLLGGQALASFLFNFRFGAIAGWSLLPGLALGGKILFSLFLIALILTFNQAIRLPDDSFVYGYIAGICSVVNIFVFSGFDFSLSLLFLLACAITIIAHRFKHPAFQALAIVGMLLPFAPYLSVLVSADAGTIGPLFLEDGQWNLRIAFFTLPYQFMFAKLFHTVGLFGRRQKFYIPLNTLFMFVPAMAMAFLILFYPAWSEDKPLQVTVFHTIDGAGEQFATEIPSLLPNLGLGQNPSRAKAPDVPRNPDGLIEMTDTSVRFLDKRLVTMSIATAVPVERIRVSVSSASGFSVYSASIPFEFKEAGSEALFLSNDRPTLPFTFSFSSDHDSMLTATVTVWTTENPWGISSSNASFSSLYLLEATKTAALASMPGGTRRTDTR